MTGQTMADAAGTAGRYGSRWRRFVGLPGRITRPSRVRPDLSTLRLGPVLIAGHVVVLRPPRYDDFDDWRQIRLRDRAQIEPFWASSELDWDTRHTERLWIRECLAQRANGRSGRNVSLVIDVDGRFGGQCSISAIDAAAASGEVGLWIDTEIARRGVGGLATAMLLDFGFRELGLKRMTAPICVDNEPTIRGAKKIGFVQEALMAGYFDAGGRRKDHGLWAIASEAAPVEGFTEQWLNSANPDRSRSSTGRDAPTRVVSRSGLPITRAAITTVGRFHLGRLTSVGRSRAVRRTLQLGPSGTPAVLLRRPRMSDYGAWRAVRSGDQTATDPPLGRARAENRTVSRTAWLRTCVVARLQWPVPDELLLLAEVNGAFIGTWRLCEVDMFRHSADLRVDLVPGHPDPSGAEIATRLFLEHGFGVLGLRRIATLCDSGDELRAGILSHAGFAREGILHNHADRDGRRGDHELWGATATAGH